MSIGIFRGTSDALLEQIVDALRGYEHDHPAAEIALYRQNQFSIRVRIIDPDFKSQDRVERNEMVWKYLERAPEEAQGDVSTLILLAPDEVKTSFSNMDFEDPLPSVI